MFRSLLYSFPIQLLINHVKKNKILLFFWLLLFGVTTGHLGGFLGLQYLLLDPEYLEQSSFWSFFIMGIMLGGFTMAFHITTYIIDVHNFSFVGALAKPFARFCLNNSIIPVAYLITYIASIVHFQRLDQQQPLTAVVVKVGGLLTGFTLLLLLVLPYVVITNRDAAQYLAQSTTRQLKQALFYRINVVRKILTAPKRPFKVESYLEMPWRVGYTKDLDKYYDASIVPQIFNQNHLSLLFFELMAIALLFALGFWGHHSFSQIPAAASVILCLTILMMLAGFISFWTRGWASTVIIGVIVALNMFTAPGVLLKRQESRALGLNYAVEKATYSLAQARALSNEEHYLQDKQHTLQMLTNWRRKFPADTPPKLIIVCASGGGPPAALWALHVLQTADSMTKGQLMEHTMLMSCVSGGAFGVSYFRELCLRKKLGEAINPYDPAYLDNIARNSLNPVVFNLITNDMLLDVNKLQYQGMTYRRDRGYTLEEQFNQHTNFMLEKPLQAYRAPEFASTIPMLLLAPTIINDGRKLFISPHSISYMGADVTRGKFTEQASKVKGIDFMRCFQEQGAANLRFLSALRMTATYPYVFPSVTLPSRPAIEVMDAGLSDNFGIADAVRFLYVFRDWIAKHTAGVGLVIIRNSAKEQETLPYVSTSLLQALTNPIGKLRKVWGNIQDIRNDDLVEFASAWLEDNITAIDFHYARQKYEKSSRVKAAWHIPKRKKISTLQAIHTQNNQRSLARLKAFLEETKTPNQQIRQAQSQQPTQAQSQSSTKSPRQQITH